MTTTAAPSLDCACGQRIDISAKHIGDSVTCGACGAFQVVIRSRTRGDIPPAAVRAGILSLEERDEVADTLKRIKLRRIGHATRHLQLYPSWAVFVAGLQFYLSAILAGHNIAAQGDQARGKKLQIIGVVSYLALGAAMLASAFLLDAIPFALKVSVAALVPLGFASYFTWTQHASCSAAREAGAGTAPVILPLLFGLIIAIAQAFAIWFLRIQLEGPLLGN